MPARERMDQVEDILRFLNEKRIRCTYGAIGKVIGKDAQWVGSHLGIRRPEASWVVNSKTRKPTGYTENQYHRDLFRTEKIIFSGIELKNALDEWRLRPGRIHDPFEKLGDDKGTKMREAASMRSRRLAPNERRALAILNADQYWGKSRIRKQYRALVKCLHPDSNCGDRSDESRLREVVWAWDQIKVSKNFSD